MIRYTLVMKALRMADEINNEPTDMAPGVRQSVNRAQPWATEQAGAVVTARGRGSSHAANVPVPATTMPHGDHNQSAGDVSGDQVAMRGKRSTAGIARPVFDPSRLTCAGKRVL